MPKQTRRAEQRRSLLSRIRLACFDFDGVFTDNRVLVSQDGKESVWCNRSDGIGLSRLKSVGVDCLVISRERNPVVRVRMKKLGVECRAGVGSKKDLLER